MQARGRQVVAQQADGAARTAEQQIGVEVAVHIDQRHAHDTRWIRGEQARGGIAKAPRAIVEEYRQALGARQDEIDRAIFIDIPGSQGEAKDWQRGEMRRGPVGEMALPVVMPELRPLDARS
jgi:hypothetical protein